MLDERNRVSSLGLETELLNESQRSGFLRDPAFWFAERELLETIWVESAHVVKVLVELGVLDVLLVDLGADVLSN